MVLVTGGSGFLGAHLLFHLAKQGEKLVAIYRKGSDLSAVRHVFSYYEKEPDQYFKAIKWLRADLDDLPALEEAFSGIEQVYHCAALISFKAADYKAMRKVNIEGTANIVNLCIARGVKKLCFASSVAAVGKSLNGKPITENSEWNIQDNNYGYAITKYGAETEVWRASQEGLEVVIVNPGIILGPGFWKSGSGKLFADIYKGFNYYSEGLTGFVSVQDTARAMIALMQSSIINQRYLLISENETYKNVFFAIADGLSKKRPKRKATRTMTGLLWRLGWLLHKLTGIQPRLSKASAKAVHNRHQYSNKKIVEALGFEFEPLAQTIKKTCVNFLEDRA